MKKAPSQKYQYRSVTLVVQLIIVYFHTLFCLSATAYTNKSKMKSVENRASGSVQNGSIPTHKHDMFEMKIKETCWHNEQPVYHRTDILTSLWPCRCNFENNDMPLKYESGQCRLERIQSTDLQRDYSTRKLTRASFRYSRFLQKYFLSLC